MATKIKTDFAALLYALVFGFAPSGTSAMAKDKLDFPVSSSDRERWNQPSNPFPVDAKISARWEGEKLFLDLLVKNTYTKTLRTLRMNFLLDDQVGDNVLTVINEKSQQAFWKEKPDYTVSFRDAQAQAEFSKDVPRISLEPGATVKSSLDVFKHYVVPPGSKKLLIKFRSGPAFSNSLSIPLKQYRDKDKEGDKHDEDNERSNGDDERGAGRSEK